VVLIPSATTRNGLAYPVNCIYKEQKNSKTRILKTWVLTKNKKTNY